MPVRLRLRRLGRKGRPYYQIVAADSRARRDGRFLEKVGTYNPIADPAEITVDHDLAIKWLKNGAQPSKTVKAILRYTGVNLKYALIKQGKSEEEIARIYGKWLEEKEAKISAKKSKIRDTAAAQKAEALKHEAEVRKTKAAEIAKKRGADEPPVEESEAPAEAEAPPAEAEAPAAEAEAPAAEAAEESPAAEAPAAE
ncbi:MAG: 30S ribosomal protein S16 [Bacteroidota bacterium]